MSSDSMGDGRPDASSEGKREVSGPKYSPYPVFYQEPIFARTFPATFPAPETYTPGPPSPPKKYEQIRALRNMQKGILPTHRKPDIWTQKSFANNSQQKLKAQGNSLQSQQHGYFPQQGQAYSQLPQTQAQGNQAQSHHSPDLAKTNFPQNETHGYSNQYSHPQHQAQAYSQYPQTQAPCYENQSQAHSQYPQTQAPGYENQSQAQSHYPQMQTPTHANQSQAQGHYPQMQTPTHANQSQAYSHYPHTQAPASTNQGQAQNLYPAQGYHHVGQAQNYPLADQTVTAWTQQQQLQQHHQQYQHAAEAMSAYGYRYVQQQQPAYQQPGVASMCCNPESDQHRGNPDPAAVPKTEATTL